MRFLAISSHVVHGHVGNAALVFPLQRLGVEVLPLHTVVYSNHLGYPRYAGRAVPAGEIQAIVDCLADEGLLKGVNGVLSGFLGEAATAKAVERAVAAAKAAGQAIYCCDPVMGDDGKLYVSQAVAQAVKERLLPLADLLTPNRYELSVLTGQPVETRDQIRRAAESLLASAKAVLVTSASTKETKAGEIDLMLVSAAGAFLISTPWLSFDVLPNGSGDIIAALFLYHFKASGGDAQKAAEAAVAGVFAVLELSSKRGGRELSLVQAQDVLVKPSRLFAALPLH